MNGENPIFHSLDLIEEKIMEKLTVETIADSIHFSKYHYQRMFRSLVGDSVMSYVTKRKLSLAGRELLETNASVIDIALKYGYDSHEGFTRSFKAYMGVSPADYRKYGLSAIFQKNRKEDTDMLYSKNTDDIIRELNDLIAQMKTVSSYARKKEDDGADDAERYAPFWELIAGKTDALAAELQKTLEQVTAIARQPDEICTRFILIKAIEDVAFQMNLTAFQTGLMDSRARPEHRDLFRPVCDKYNELAKKSRMKAEKITIFFNELAAMIFEDMRNNAVHRIQATAAKGQEAAEHLKNGGDAACAYITDEITVIADEISSLPLDEVTISRMEDILFRLRIISFAADTDLFRVPAYQETFHSISAFSKSLEETVEFLKSLPDAASGAGAETGFQRPERTMEKEYSALAIQGNILLFYIRGEIQKLGSARLGKEQKAAFDLICRDVNTAILLAQKAEDETTFDKMAKILYEVQRKMTAEADRLGMYGSAIQFLADETGLLASAAERTK